MNIFDILKQLYTNPKSDWILNVDEKTINPVMIQRFITLHKSSAKKARILNKFVFNLPPKMYLSAAWSILYFNDKKLSKPPFIKYRKKKDVKPDYHYVLDKVKKQFEMSNKDLDIVKPFLINAIKNDKVTWFSYYGIDKVKWRENVLDVDLMREYGDRPKVKNGLDAFL